MVICGDSQQCDLPSRVTSGFSHAMDLLKGVRRVGFVELDVEDIIRHRLIKDIILRYERPELQHLSSPDSPEDEARDYVNKTHFPGWQPDREGFDFSEDDLDDEPTQDEINEDNERFADEWRRRKTAT
jgi:phosphate starvation-inducible PhoH-like protein